MIILQKSSKKVERILIFVLFLAILTSIFLISQRSVDSKANEGYQASVSEPIQAVAEPKLVTQETAGQIETPRKIENPLLVNAKSAISVKFGYGGYGIGEKVLFEKNKDEKLPLASLVKLMTALIVLEKYDLNRQVVISHRAMEQTGDQGGLKEGETLSVENLLYIMLMESSNRAAYALSELVGSDDFVYFMNEQAKALGLINTYFEDSTGLSDKSHSTAEDLTSLSSYLFLNFPLFGKIAGLLEFNLYLSDGSFHHKLVNTNELLYQNGVIGGKTGYTLEAGGCFMVIQKKSEDGYIINIVLGADDRLAEMRKLMDISELGE